VRHLADYLAVTLGDGHRKMSLETAAAKAALTDVNVGIGKRNVQGVIEE
jgi:hypothetical protein